MLAHEIAACVAHAHLAAHLRRLQLLNRRPQSIAKRAATLRHFARFAGLECLLGAEPEQLRAFADRPTLGPEARNTVISHLRGFYRWAHDEDLVARDLSERLERPKRARRLPRPMRDDAVALALNAAPDPIRAWLHLAAYAGLRACEIAQLSGHDFVLAQRPPIIIIQEGKGGHAGVVPVALALAPIAHELAAARGWCFPRGAGDPSGQSWSGHVTAGQVSHRSNRFLHQHGIAETLHQLRHWYGTELHRAAGGNLRVTQEGMRHRSTNSTAIYTYVEDGAVARALDALPQLTA